MEKRERFFYGLSAAGALAILSSTMAKNPILPLFAESLGAEGATLGLIAAASTIPGILISLPAGSLSDRWGRRRVMYLAAAVFATAPFLYLLVDSPEALMAVRFYHGFATAIFGTVANAAIVDAFPDQKAGRLAFYSSSTSVGRSIAPFLGGAILILTNYSYGDVYAVVGLAGVSALLSIVLVYRRDGESKGSQERQTPLGEQLQSIVSDHKVLVASSVEAVQYFANGAFEFFIVIYAAAAGVSLAYITLITGSQLVTVVLIKPLLGRLSDRAGRRRIIAMGLLLGSVSVLLVPLTANPTILIILSVIFGVGFAAVTSSTQALVSDLCTRSGSGSTMGFLNTIMDIGQAAGPIVTGAVVASSLSFVGGFGLLAMLLLAMAILFSLTFRSRGD